MSAEKDKMLELIAKVINDYFEADDMNTEADAIDVVFTIDEILSDTNIVENAHLYNTIHVPQEKNPIGFDVVGD